MEPEAMSAIVSEDVARAREWISTLGRSRV
jgi:hypothetical protein